MKANLRDTVIKLGVSDIQEILSIEMDSDPERALSFIKNKLSRKVRELLRDH